MPCLPCAAALLAADGPSFTKLLADARQGHGCDCANHAAPSSPETPMTEIDELTQNAARGVHTPPPTPQGVASNVLDGLSFADGDPAAKSLAAPGSCQECHDMALLLAADPAFLSVAQKFPGIKMSLCPSCQTKNGAKVFGDDSDGDDSDDSSSTSSTSSDGSTPNGASSTPPAGLNLGNFASGLSAAASAGLAIGQATGLIKTPAKAAPPPPPPKAPPPPPPKKSAKSSSLKWEIGAAALVVLVIIYFVTLPPKSTRSVEDRGGGSGPGPDGRGSAPVRPTFSVN